MTGKILGFILCVAYGPAVVAQTGQASGAETAAGIPGLEISYYDVSGSNGVKIRKEINRLRPVDPVGKKPFDGLANYNFGWGWPIDANRQCDLQRTKISFKASVILPRLTNYASLPDALRKRWDKYEAALRERQLGRVSTAYSQNGNLLAAIKGATCENANEAANKFLTEIAKSVEEYVKRDNRERRESVSFP